VLGAPGASLSAADEPSNFLETGKEDALGMIALYLGVVYRHLNSADNKYNTQRQDPGRWHALVLSGKKRGRGLAPKYEVYIDPVRRKVDGSHRPPHWLVMSHSWTGGEPSAQFLNNPWRAMQSVPLGSTLILPEMGLHPECCASSSDMFMSLATMQLWYY